MLELQSVNAGYLGSRVLHDVSIQVQPGTVVALLGPNGAGKTTLLRVASRMLDVDSGRVIFDGKDVTAARCHDLVGRGLCHIPEGRGVFPALTVRDNILQFAHNMPAARAVAMATEAFPALTRRLSNLAGSLSGGERQMLALVRAWINKPPVVLLDEVSMGLAPVIVDDVYRFIQRLAAEGCALLIVEQYVARVRELATGAYVLSKGRVQFAGAVGDLGKEKDLLGYYLGAASPK